MIPCPPVSRRRFLTAAGATSAGFALGVGRSAAADRGKALIAITLDMEMSANFPTWEQTEWNYEKGNLNEPTKKYIVEACRRVKAAGGVIHCFALGRTLEQPNVDWLKGIIASGHPIGNHTYDHVNVKARKLSDVQFRFRRVPWLLSDRLPLDVIAENIRITNAAFKSRLGIEPAGIRVPGGFSNALDDRPDVQQVLQELGFTWVSGKYPAHPLNKPGSEPGADIYAALLKAQEAAQPYVYPRGLIEVPRSPISDIGAFRGGRWKLEWFLKAIRRGVEWAIARQAVFDFLGHPSCLYVTDPEFRTIDMICDLVRQAGSGAALVDLGTIAARAKTAGKASN